MGDFTRGLAFSFVVIFFIGTFIGSVLPESGNYLAKYLGISSHSFNIFFLFVGILGIGLALCFGLKNGR